MSVLLELVLRSEYAGQQCVTRFNYLGTGTPGEDNAAAALVQAFGCVWDGTEYPAGLPFADMLLLQNASVVYQFASARDVYNDEDFNEVPFVHPAVGSGATGQPMSPFNAYGWRTNLIRLDIGRGYKRLVGVGEGGVGDFGLLTSGVLAEMSNVGEAFGAVLTQSLGGNTFTFAPVIAGKQRYNPSTGLADPAGTAYRYYPDVDDQMEKLAAGIIWENYDHVRTQTSRQVGKGR